VIVIARGGGEGGAEAERGNAHLPFTQAVVKVFSMLDVPFKILTDHLDMNIFSS
jgi:hypothetical protein